MMEKLITVRDVRERYGVSGSTARRYLRQMPHYEKPLTAPQWAFREWEKDREMMPGKYERVIVPRKRG